MEKKRKIAAVSAAEKGKEPEGPKADQSPKGWPAIKMALLLKTMNREPKCAAVFTFNETNHAGDQVTVRVELPPEWEEGLIEVSSKVDPEKIEERSLGILRDLGGTYGFAGSEWVLGHGGEVVCKTTLPTDRCWTLMRGAISLVADGAGPEMFGSYMASVEEHADDEFGI